MVHDHCYRMFCPREVVLPLLQSLDDGKEFSIIDVVVSFYREKVAE